MKVALHGWLGSFGLLVLAVSTGCAFGAGSFEEISEPTKAVIYVYRPSGFYGSFVRANVYIDANVRIGALKTNSYAVAVVEPGKHTLRGERICRDARNDVGARLDHLYRGRDVRGGCPRRCDLER